MIDAFCLNCMFLQSSKIESPYNHPMMYKLSIQSITFDTNSFRKYTSDFQRAIQIEYFLYVKKLQYKKSNLSYKLCDSGASDLITEILNVEDEDSCQVN
jgi:hypothetical protein